MTTEYRSKEARYEFAARASLSGRHPPGRVTANIDGGVTPGY